MPMRIHNIILYTNIKNLSSFSNSRTRVRKQPIIALYFEFETVLKFHNLGPSQQKVLVGMCHQRLSMLILAEP